MEGLGGFAIMRHAGKIAEDAASCAIIAREVGAVQQLILMALSDSEIVVQQACKILGAQPLPAFLPVSGMLRTCRRALHVP